jgi:hypothetical protein
MEQAGALPSLHFIPAASQDDSHGLQPAAHAGAANPATRQAIPKTPTIRFFLMIAPHLKKSYRVFGISTIPALSNFKGQA